MVILGKKRKWILLLESRPLLVTLFIIFFGVSVWIDAYLYPEKNLNGLYLINIIFAGIAFWRSVTLQIIMTILFTWLYYYFAPFHSTHVNIIIFQGMTYLLAILSVSIAIRYYIKEQENTVNLSLTLAKSLDARDKYTAHHSENVANYAYAIAKAMRLSSKQCEQVYLGGILHDIGKIGVPESILTKPSVLTREEYDTIKQHPVIGYEMVKHISFFQNQGVLDAILYHHERYDGRGYPRGLSGQQIPQIARILAIADTFDAMTTRRVYRDKVDMDHVIQEIHRNKGAQFDPEITDVFLRLVIGKEITVRSDYADKAAR